MEVRTGTVSQINAYVKKILDNNKILNNVNVKGEISNFKRHSSGHIYLTLKDQGGVLKAVMFRMAASRLTFNPADGMKVIANGRVTVYEAGGAYQLYIEDMIPDGIGSLYEAYERLKKRLEFEGLFSMEYKKAIPRFPRAIGVITAPTGAAVRDIINVITRRYPLAEIILYPAQVQGAGAAQSVVNGIKYFNSSNTVDIIIADIVADLRAPTPSAAAEIAVPSASELKIRINTDYSRLTNAVLGVIKRKRLKLSGNRLKTPKQRIEENMLRLDSVSKRMERDFENILKEKKLNAERLDIRAKNSFRLRLSKEQKRFGSCVAKLDALSPLSVLSRGYAIPLGQDGVIKSVKKMKSGMDFRLKMADGEKDCVVK